MRCRRAAVTAIAAIVAGLGVAACGGSDDESGGASEEGPIVIGAAMAKTGFMSQFDIPAVEGAKLAIEDINADGGVDGRKLRLIQVDSKSDKTQAANAATQLISEHGAQALLVSCDFDFGGPAAIVGQQQDRLAFGCAASPRFGVQGIGNNAFTLDTYTQGEGAAGAEWAYNSKGWRTAYLLVDQSIDYTKTLGEFFAERFTQLAGRDAIVGRDTFLNDDPSLAAQVTRIRSLSEQPDFIYLPSCPPGAATAIRQIRTAGIDTPIVSGVCMDGDFWLKGLGDLSNYFYTPWISTYGNDPRDEVNQFMDRFLEAADNPQQRQFGVVGYSAMEAYARAAKEAGGVETQAVRSELESFRDVPLLIGPTSFTEELHGDPGRPFAVLEIENGEHRYVEQWEPQKPPEPDL